MHCFAVGMCPRVYELEWNLSLIWLTVGLSVPSAAVCFHPRQNSTHISSPMPPTNPSSALYKSVLIHRVTFLCTNKHLSSSVFFPSLSQGCSKTFPTKEKLTKHLEVHKQPKQFCCPHQNCNRVFLRQSHLKNHLKIHTQDSFVCPVMGKQPMSSFIHTAMFSYTDSPILPDCNQKFGSEADYNVHLNSHMNYGHKCQVTGCGHAFSTRKRLELHCRVMHGLELNGRLLNTTHKRLA